MRMENCNERMIIDVFSKLKGSARLFLLALSMVLVSAMHTLCYGGYYVDDDIQTFKGGFVGGLNMAQVDGDRYFGYHKPGINIGAVVRAKLAGNFGMAMEMLFTQKGSQGDAVVETVYGPTYVAKCHIGLDYVEVPLTFWFDFKKIVFETGVSYNRLVHTKEWILNTVPQTIDPVANAFQPNAWDFIAGLNRQVSKHWFVNLRFQYSLVPIRNTANIPSGYGYGLSGQFSNLFALRVLYII